MAADAATSGGTVITSVENSALYVDGNSEFLVRTLSGAGTSRKTFTIGGWFYKTRVGSGSDCRIFQWDSGSTNVDRGMILIDNTTPDAIKLLIEDASDVVTMVWTSTQLLRDQAWYHWCLTVDTTPATPIFKFFLNNEEITAWTKSTDTIAQDDVFAISDSGARQAWGSAPEGTGYFDGYQAECFLLDGQVVTDATDFVDVSADGLYVTPKSNEDMQTLTFGINGYYLGNDLGAPQYDSNYLDPTTYVPVPVTFDGTNDYMRMTSDPMVDSALGTVSFWIKFNGGNGASQTLWCSEGTHFMIQRPSTNILEITGYTSGDSQILKIKSTGLLLTTGSWQHVVASWNQTTQTQHFYLDGVEDKNASGGVNSAGVIDYTRGTHTFGAFQDATQKTNADIAQFYLTTEYIDLSDSDELAKFITTDGYPVSMGSDGSTPTGTAARLYFDSAVDSWHTNDGAGGGMTETGALTAGSTVRSAKANDFTNNNSVTLSANTPTNLENRWNPLWYTTGQTLSNANKTGQVTNSGNQTITSTLTLPSTGKWYIELDCDTESYSIIGLLNANGSGGEPPFNQGDTARGYYQVCELYGYISSNGVLFTKGNGDSGNSASYGTAYDNSDYIGIAADCDNGNLFFSKSNTWQNSATAGEIAAGTGTNAATTALDNEYVVVLFGAGATEKFTFVDEADWSGTAPTGFIALTTTNIAAETTRTAADVGEHWNNFLYTGNGTAIGSGGNALTGMGFQPDFLWIKNRDSARSPDVNDVLLTVEDFLYTDSTGALGTSAESLSAFGSDGFTVGSNLGWNESSDKLISWSAKLGGAPTATNSAGAGATPTAGSVKIDDVNLGSALAGSIAATKITSNTTLGMSATTYTGTGANATVAHGLGVVPEMVICKGLDTVNHWVVYHKALGNTSALLLNSTNAQQSADAKWWNNTTPTSSVVSLGTAGDSNASTKLFIMYAFASSQFISIGSYDGNNNADGPFIPFINSLGVPISPIFVLGKNYETAGAPWFMVDASTSPYNVRGNYLVANSAAVESASASMDFITGGAKFRATGYWNEASKGVVYLAIGIPIIDTDGRIIAGR